MKTQVSPVATAAIVVVVAGAIGALFYFKTQRMYSGADAPKIPMTMNATTPPNQPMETPKFGNGSGAPSVGGTMNPTLPGGGGGSTAPGMGGGMAPPPAPGNP